MNVDLAEEIRVAAAAAAAELSSDEVEEEEDADYVPPVEGEAPWRLGAGERTWVPISAYSQSHLRFAYPTFEMDLRAFIIATYPDLASKCTGSVQVCFSSPFPVCPCH